jgi:methylphosphotriester-DNA--protein-cysteine methyltransferase
MSQELHVPDQDFVNLGMDGAAYEKLEQEFSRVLNEMQGERSMDRFRDTYERLHRALKTSYESEKKLFKRCREMNDSITANATRVKAAIKLTQEDASAISMLKKEVDKAWKLVEKAKEKEETARRLIEDSKAEINNLHKIMQSG